jgi:hypothetical protein
MQCITDKSTLTLLLILAGLFHLFILVFFGLGVRSNPFSCFSLGPFLACSIPDPDFNIQPFLE